MDDSRKTNESGDQILDKVMQQISADKVTAHNWNTWSLVLIYMALVTVIVLELEDVDVGIVTAVAVSSLLAFLIINRVHRKKLEKQTREEKIDGYRKFLLRGTHRGEDGASAIETTLSRREIQILQLIAEGNINKQIARELGLSPATVRNHVSRLMQKLDVNDRTAAAVMALSNGWIHVDRRSKPDETKRIQCKNRSMIGTR